MPLQSQGGNIQTPTTENFISTYDMINARNVDERLYEKFPKSLMKIIEMIGAKTVTTNPKYEWAEADRIFQTIIVASTVTQNTPGATATITLATASHYGNGTKSYPQVGLVSTLPNKVQFQVVAVNKTVDSFHTITLKPTKAAQALGVITGGSKIMFANNAYPEHSRQGKGYTPIPFQYENVCQIIKWDSEVSSTQAATKSYFNIDGQFRWSLKAEKDAWKQFEYMKGIALLANDNADPNYVNGDGELVRMTKGLIPSIREEGNNFSYETFDRNTLSLITKALVKNGGVSDNLFYGGFNIIEKLQNLVDVGMKNDETNYSFFNSPGKSLTTDSLKKRAVEIGVDKLTLMGHTFHFMVGPEFTEENVLGTSGYNYDNTAVIIPNGSNRITYQGQETEAKFFGIRYLQDRYNEIWPDGAGTGVKTKIGDLDANLIHYRCEIGAQTIAANRLSLVE